MGLAPWVRDRLWRANHWCGELALLRQVVAAEPRTASTPERLYDLARATEYCDPDRGRAMALYLEAWRGGHAEAGDRAKALAVALRAHMAVAEIALADGDLGTAGGAFLDAGFPELAVEPLQRLVAARPAGASSATENVRIAGVKALLALAGRQRFDAEREIAETVARAHHETGRAAAAAYVHAARIARLASLGDRLAGIVAAAARACPEDDEVSALVEERLFETGDADSVLEHYRVRFERSPTRHDYVERARAAGVELIARNFQPGLGLRLLRMSLEAAYEAKLPEPPSHLAAWELMTTHARAQQSTVDLVPLIVQGLSAPMSGDGAFYLARLGLEIAWRDASDTLAAQPYAAMVLDFLPDHPLASAFVAEVTPEVSPEVSPEASTEPPPEPESWSPRPGQKPALRSPAVDEGPIEARDACLAGRFQAARHHRPARAAPATSSACDAAQARHLAVSDLSAAGDPDLAPRAAQGRAGRCRRGAAERGVLLDGPPRRQHLGRLLHHEASARARDDRRARHAHPGPEHADPDEPPDECSHRAQDRGRLRPRVRRPRARARRRDPRGDRVVVTLPA